MLRYMVLALAVPSALSQFLYGPRLGGFGGFWGYPGLGYPAQPPVAPAVPSHTRAQPTTDVKPSEETKEAYEKAMDAYNEYQKALIEAQSKKAIENVEGKGSATRLKPAGKCQYHFQCDTEHLCFSGQCLPVGGKHKGQSCGSIFSKDCEDGEACFQFTCFPAESD